MASLATLATAAVGSAAPRARSSLAPSSSSSSSSLPTAAAAVAAAGKSVRPRITNAGPKLRQIDVNSNNAHGRAPTFPEKKPAREQCSQKKGKENSSGAGVQNQQRGAGVPTNDGSTATAEITGHRITAGGEVEFEVKRFANGNSATATVCWESRRSLAEDPALDTYHEEKGCCRPKGKKRKAELPLSTGDDLDYITAKNKGNCAICLEGRSDEEDPVVYCEKCNLGVHRFCYGYPLSKKIPKGEWVCDRCRAGAQNERCVLCPMKKGVMKKTTDSKWAHIACAMWVPEVYFRVGMGMEAIDTFQVAERRWLNLCSICKIPQGACLECSHDGCTNKFHLTCGLKRKCHLDYEESRNGGYCVYSFCPYHASFWRETQERREARLAKHKKGKQQK